MPTNHPNIVFVFADQMRAQAAGFMGNKQVRTENLDRLAAGGVTFTHAVSSCPVCTPYRASLLTGKHVLSNGMLLNDVRLPVGENSIATVLAEAGYDTGYIGKWHLDGPLRGGFTPPGPRRQGFDYWAAAESTHEYLRSFYYRDDPEPIWIEGYDADHFTDLAIEYLHSRDHGKPFCLFLSWGPPHDPYLVMPDEYMIHDPANIQLRPNVTTDWREAYAGYYSHVAALDRNFGRLMAALEEAGLTDDTIVVFTSDHGDMLGSQDQKRKQKPWDESIMVPFVMRWPSRCPAGHRTSALINAMDVMPTLLELAAVPVPDTVEGESFAAAALGAETCGPRSAFVHSTCPFGGPQNPSPPEWRGIRTARYTYAKTLAGPWLFYDNEADPYQLENLVDKPAYRRVQNELEDQLQWWLERIGDDFAPREVYWERLGLEVNQHGAIPYDDEVGKSEL